MRTADGHDQEERRASWLELFFDLVFAGAVGQLAGALQGHPTLHGVGRFGMLFVPIWWLWVRISFYADRHESEDAAHRVAFLSAMLLCLGLGAGAPAALAGNTDGFIIAFACLRALQLVLYARARHHLPTTRALYSRFLVFFGAGGALGWRHSPAAGRRATPSSGSPCSSTPPARWPWCLLAGGSPSTRPIWPPGSRCSC